MGLNLIIPNISKSTGKAKFFTYEVLNHLLILLQCRILMLNFIT